MIACGVVCMAAAQFWWSLCTGDHVAIWCVQWPRCGDTLRAESKAIMPGMLKECLLLCYFAAPQGVLDFCNQLSFIRNVYLNLDCRIERNNLFEAIASLLSKTAFPVNSPLGSVHLLSLEGLFSILSALSAS